MNVNLEAMRERYRRSVPGAVDRRFPLWQETCIDVATLIDELERATNERDRWMDDYYERKHALQKADAVAMSVRFALCTDGWRPPRGVDPLVDLALDVREERDRLRAEVKQLRRLVEARARVMRREGDLLRAAQREVDELRAEVERLRAERDAACVELVNERAAVVAWLRDGMGCGQHAVAFVADHIERGEHRREEER